MSELAEMLREFWWAVAVAVATVVMFARQRKARADALVLEEEDPADTEDDGLDRLTEAFEIDSGNPRRRLIRWLGSSTVVAVAIVVLLLLLRPAFPGEAGGPPVRISPVDNVLNGVAVVVIFSAVIISILFTVGILTVRVSGRAMEIARSRSEHGKFSVDQRHYDVTEVVSHRVIGVGAASALVVVFEGGDEITISDPERYKPLLDYLERAVRLRLQPRSRSDR